MQLNYVKVKQYLFVNHCQQTYRVSIRHNHGPARGWGGGPIPYWISTFENQAEYRFMWPKTVSKLRGVCIENKDPSIGISDFKRKNIAANEAILRISNNKQPIAGPYNPRISVDDWFRISSVGVWWRGGLPLLSCNRSAIDSAWHRR